MIRAATAVAGGKKPNISDDVAAVVCSALSVSVTCNVYLVCAALKMVILTFKLFQFGDIIPPGAIEGFKYLNVYSNFLLIVKSSLHAAVILLYNYRVRHIVITIVRQWIPRRGFFRRDDSQEWDSEEAPDVAAQDANKVPIVVGSSDENKV